MSDVIAIDTLARTLYGEAAPNNVHDAEAIASVVMNRVNYKQWPDAVVLVCKQPWQFSCWNVDNPRLEQILSVTPASSPWFAQCEEIATSAIGGQLADPTSGSTHYYASYIPAPRWARGKTPVYEVGVHRYFNDIDTPPPRTAREALDQERPLGKSRTTQGNQLTVLGGIVTAIIGGLAALPTWAQIALVVALLAIVAGVVRSQWGRIEDRIKGFR